LNKQKHLTLRRIQIALKIKYDVVVGTRKTLVAQFRRDTCNIEYR